MKRSKIKFEQIISIENCIKSIENASRNKSKKRKRELVKAMKVGKLSKNSVNYILFHKQEYAEKLRSFLIRVLEGTEKFHEGTKTIINNDGTTKKRRVLCKPLFFPDQCAHWAIMQIVEPEISKGFYKKSFASIKGGGTHKAKDTANKFFSDLKGTKYCLQIDVKGFFDHIDKEILASLFENKIKDKRIICLLKSIIYSFKGAGIPLGYYTSSAFANFYLTQNDYFISEKLKIKYFCRYMDDMVLFSGNKKVLHNAVKRINFNLKNTRNVFLKRNWQVYKMPFKNHENRFCDFVGFRLYRYKTTLRKSIMCRATRCFRSLMKNSYNLLLAHRFISYNGYLKSTDSFSLETKYIKNSIKIPKIKEIIKNESRDNYLFKSNAGTVFCC